MLFEKIPSLRSTLLMLFVALGSLGVSPAPAQEEEPDLERIESLAKDAPAPVKAFVTRKLECYYWAGEEPYDKARAREIARAMKRLNCDSLERDEAALRPRFAQDPKAVAAFAAAKELPF